MAFPADGMESTYRNNIDDVARMLKDNHEDRCMVYNLSERQYDYSKFDNQVHEWCGFPDHHAPPLAKLFQIVKSMYSWLLADPKNVAAVHCLAGKGRTGTVIAAFLLYAGLFSDAEKALNYFACKRSNTNWGVTNPAQLRYVQYFADILYKEVNPSPKSLKLTYIHLNNVPNFSSYIGAYVGRPGGCCPFIHIYNITHTKKLIYSSENEHEEMKSYAAGQSVTFEMNVPLKGDILVEVYHVTPFYRTEHMLRCQFHTGMIKSNVLHFTRGEIDLACQDKRFSSDFFMDLGFEPITKEQDANPADEGCWWENTAKGDGAICFFDPDKLLEAKQTAYIKSGKIEKGGWLTKRGHKVKNMKRRWFVLRDPTLCYYKSPRDTTPAGIIILDDILAVVSEKNIYKDAKPSEKNLSFWFEIITKKTNYLICAETEQEMREWVEDIEYVLRSPKVYNSPSKLLDSEPKSWDERSMTMNDEFIPPSTSNRLLSKSLEIPRLFGKNNNGTTTTATEASTSTSGNNNSTQTFSNKDQLDSSFVTIPASTAPQQSAQQQQSTNEDEHKLTRNDLSASQDFVMLPK